jgi:hypothetical protein
VLALVDSDPYGLKILSVYMKGRALNPPSFPFLPTRKEGNVVFCDLFRIPSRPTAVLRTCIVLNSSVS